MCTLCDSWDHCPANPNTKHPKPRAATEHDVETALLTGFTWGLIDGGLDNLCADHRAMIQEMRRLLGK